MVSTSSRQSNRQRRILDAILSYDLKSFYNPQPVQITITEARDAILFSFIHSQLSSGLRKNSWRRNSSFSQTIHLHGKLQPITYDDMSAKFALSIFAFKSQRRHFSILFPMRSLTRSTQFSTKKAKPIDCHGIILSFRLVLLDQWIVGCTKNVVSLMFRNQFCQFFIGIPIIHGHHGEMPVVSF